MKKMFGSKKITKEKIIEFLDKKGFYVVLAACVVVVGITAFLMLKGNSGPIDRAYENEDYIPDEMGEDFENDTEDYAFGLEDGALKESSNDTVEGGIGTSDGEGGTAGNLGDTDSAGGTDSSAALFYDDTEDGLVASGTVKAGEEQKSEPETFIMPVFGEISFDYAMDRLVYSKTLDEWRTHRGIDISSSMGTPVKAVADGVVTQIKHDPRFGITIVIEHKSGLKTVYCNLANDSMVVPNQKVRQGEVISSIGDTALFEIAEPAHLHFEVWKDDVPVDPKDYLSPAK
jgi:murein DD-endopeptidase MepM/ murein hydrolase activator NlpD